MRIESRPAAAAGVVALLLFAGCLSAGGGQVQSTITTQTTVSTPTPATSGCPSGLAFYGLDSPGDYAWASDQVAVGYTLPANSTALLVVFEGEAVLGTTRISNTNSEYPVAADGDKIPLDEPLNGSHEIQVVAYQDSDHDGQFDPETDAPCHANGNPVATDVREIDFSAFEERSTSTEAAS